VTNNILRTEQNPDKLGEFVDIYMTDEEWLAAYDPISPNLQIIRDKIAAKLANEASKQADLSELRGQKFADALQAAQADLAAWDTMTAGQKMDATKRMLNRQIAMMKVLWRILS